MIAEDEDDRRARDDAEEERHYWDSLEDARREEEEKKAARHRELALEAMTSWFFEQFEDPQYDTPIDGEDQTYIYAWGGPFEASDVLHGQFGGEYDEALVAAAVEVIEADGIVEWAPTSTGDFYDHPDPEDEVPVAPEADSQALTGQILDRLDKLEAMIACLPGTAGNVGHNAPPLEIGLPPYADEEARAMATAIAETRIELASPAPDPARLETLSQRFKGYAVKIGAYVAKKGDLAVDEAIKTSIKAATWTAALGLLGEVARGLIALAKQLLTTR